MEVLPVWMIRRHLADLPTCPLPEGFTFRAFRLSDEQAWAEIHHAAGQFDTFEAALARFQNDFGPWIDELADRCFFVAEERSGRLVASATAWRNPDFLGECYGHMHWVSVRPDFQGLGIGRGLIARVLRRLAESHSKVYLKTKSFRLKAISIYLDFGFEPLLMEDTCGRAWRGIAEALSYSALERFRH